MKKNIPYYLIVFALILWGCSEEAPEVEPQVSNLPELIDDDCLYCAGGGGTGGGSSVEFKLFMRGKNSLSINQGRSSNGTTWVGQGAVSSPSETNVGPASVYFNNKIYVFHADPASGYQIKYSYSSDGGNTWQGNTVMVSGATTLNPLTAAVWNNQIYVAFESPIGGFGGDDRILIMRSSDGTNWNNPITVAVTSAENQGAFEGTNSGYLTVHNNELYIFYNRGNDDKVFYKKFNGINSTWGSPVEITGSVGGAIQGGKFGVTAASLNGNLYAVYHANNNRMVARQVVPATATTTAVYVTSSAKTAFRPTMTADGNKLVLVYRGESSSQTFYATSTNGTNWSGNLWAVGETSKPPYVICY